MENTQASQTPSQDHNSMLLRMKECAKQPKLARFSEKIEEEELRDIRMRVLMIPQLLGIQNPPDAEATKKIAFYMIRNFSDLSMEEIEYAFELYSIGSIQSSHPFGMFSTPFIFDIVGRKYRVLKKRVIDDHKKKKEQKILSPDEAIAEEMRFQETQRRIIEEYIEEHKAAPKDGLYAAAYSALDRAGEIKMSAPEKREYAKNYLDSRIKYLRGQANGNPFNKFKIEKEIDELMMNRSPLLLYQCREAIARAYYKKFAEEKLNENSETKTARLHPEKDYDASRPYSR